MQATHNQPINEIAPSPMLDLLARRRSPYAFSSRRVEPEKLRSLFEAARWAPSSYNQQPWSFIVATRENPTDYLSLLSCLVEANQQWAQQAPVLALAAAKLNFERDGKRNRHAFYDLGQSVADLTVQATALGLYVHQMAGFDVERARQLFQIPTSWEPVAALAIGYLDDADQSNAQNQTRTRKPVEEFVFSGRWGEVLPLLFEGSAAGRRT